MLYWHLQQAEYLGKMCPLNFPSDFMLFKGPSPLSTDLIFQITICIEDFINPCMTSCRQCQGSWFAGPPFALSLFDFSECWTKLKPNCLTKLNLTQYILQFRIIWSRIYSLQHREELIKGQQIQALEAVLSTALNNDSDWVMVSFYQLR